MPPADPADICSATAYVAEVLAPQITSGDWDGPAGGLAWDCRQTLAHTVDACDWYAGLLARAGDGDLEVAEMRRDARPHRLRRHGRRRGAGISHVGAAGALRAEGVGPESEGARLIPQTPVMVSRRPG